MFKQKLHEYCQSKSWLLPEYRAKREGPHHSPRFKGSILVNGVSFTSPLFAHSVKEAHNLAAKTALNHFLGSSNLGMTATEVPASSGIQISETQATSLDIGNMFKNQLQTFAQKRNLPLPVYSTERKGDFHRSLFKSKVTLEGKTYESEKFFHNLKEAETAAAKIAIASIKGAEEDNPSIYKNLLQEFLLKGTPCHPKYTTVQAGPPHMPTFVSTVEIRGDTFKGEQAKTKKQAELNVAKIAFISLRDGKFKKNDKLNLVRATSHVMKAPPSSLAKIPDVTTPNSSKNVSWHAKFMSKVSNARLMVTKDPSSATPPNHHFTSMTGSGSVQNPKATSSVPKSVCYPAARPTSRINSWSAGGSSLDEMKRKKKKITVLPQNSNKRPAYIKPGTHERPPGFMKTLTNASLGYMKSGTNARPGYMKPEPSS